MAATAGRSPGKPGVRIAGVVGGRREVFHDVLAVAMRGGHRPLIDRLDAAVFDLVGAGGRLRHAQDVARVLREKSPLVLSAELGAEVGPPLRDEPGRSRIPSRRFDPPTFVFDFSGGKKHRYPDTGLDTFGPFDSEGFSPKTPRVVVVTPRSVQGTVESFLTSFRNGVPGGRVFNQGFTRKYRLTDCTIVLKPFDGDMRDSAAYRQACLEAVSSTDDIHLAIVVTSERQEDLTGNDSPYLVSKSIFMSQGIPVQEVQVESIQNGDRASVLNSMALACYAKLGGTPYVISAPPRAMAHELVIGIGSSHIRTSRMAEPERVVGITTVFSSDGSYILSHTSREAAYEDYPRELLRALEVCINDIKRSKTT
ncbi:hypothetical protein E1286_44120 [Nonomuraea terrae]|uniref:Protein argonaute n=1 Tax=Nonomuraea terrae TaxID=2530383 RepID=A0A4R4XN57_9ACTN|nr:hypothetical protein E1286_44120 [Nonomuraea terrae]